MELDNCKGFQYTFASGVYKCNPKTQLRSGHSWNTQGYFYLRLSKAHLFSNIDINPMKNLGLSCTEKVVDLEREYVKNRVSKPVRFLLWFACGVGGVEIICIVLVWGLLKSNEDIHGYAVTATGFKRFGYAELKTTIRVSVKKLEEAQEELFTKVYWLISEWQRLRYSTKLIKEKQNF